jgi:hypothetical protein
VALFASDSELIAQARGLADGSVAPQRQRWETADLLSMLADALERQLRENASLAAALREYEVLA